MKNFLIGVFAIVLCLVLVGCGESKKSEPSNENEQNVSFQTPIVSNKYVFVYDNKEKQDEVITLYDFKEQNPDLPCISLNIKIKIQQDA